MAQESDRLVRHCTVNRKSVEAEQVIVSGATVILMSEVL